MKAWRGLALGAATFALGAALLVVVHRSDVAGTATAPFWIAVLVFWLMATLFARDLAALEPGPPMARRVVEIAVPLLFGALVLTLWELSTVGAGVPAVLIPSPSAVAVRFATHLPTLGADLVQTFFKGALAGFSIAILCDRVTFLRRGLMPLGTLASAMPIVGVAPIMVMWFGFDWPSKAAVVALMTFFPMQVNTDAGLAATGRLERDLMRTYGAGYGTTLLKLRLPAALPFLFTGLKVNATLALIGAIVAEFFGTPTVGMGFRISVEAARLSLDMVWAEIALAAFAGSAFYAAIVLIENGLTRGDLSMRTK